MQLKAKEDKWIEVIPAHRKRTKQKTTNKERIKRQTETENHYHVLRNPQETNEVTKGLELKRETRGITKANARIQKNKKNTKPS
jgi:hypothetical protein